MASRLILHQDLKEFLGNKNVYFQPPESIKLSYPCIVYHLSNIVTAKADNINYKKDNEYTLTLIHNDPDNVLKDEILDRYPSISFATSFTKDGLNHYVYNLYY